MKIPNPIQEALRDENIKLVRDYIQSQDTSHGAIEYQILSVLCRSCSKEFFSEVLTLPTISCCIKGKLGFTLLCLAAGCNPDLIPLLLGAGVDPAQDMDMDIYMDMDMDIEMDNLLPPTEDTNYLDYCTPLGELCETISKGTFQSSQYTASYLIKSLIEKGAKVNVEVTGDWTDDWLESPLYRLCRLVGVTSHQLDDDGTLGEYGDLIDLLLSCTNVSTRARTLYLCVCELSAILNSDEESIICGHVEKRLRVWFEVLKHQMSKGAIEEMVNLPLSQYPFIYEILRGPGLIYSTKQNMGVHYFANEEFVESYKKCLRIVQHVCGMFIPLDSHQTRTKSLLIDLVICSYELHMPFLDVFLESVPLEQSIQFIRHFLNELVDYIGWYQDLVDVLKDRLHVIQSLKFITKRSINKVIGLTNRERNIQRLPLPPTLQQYIMDS